MAALLGGHWSRPTPFSRLALKKFSLGDKRTNFWKTVSFLELDRSGCLVALKWGIIKRRESSTGRRLNFFEAR